MRRVRRRHVFYLGGFDPQGPAHYHRLYAEEGPKQAAVGDYGIEVGPRRRGGAWSSLWDVRSRWADGEAVATTVEFLRWDDIVRQHWPRSRLAVMLGTLATTARQLANGVLWRILKTSWPAFLVLFLPPLLVVSLALLLGVIAAVALASARVTGALGALAIALALLWALAGFARWAEAKVQMAWLMRSTRFILMQARGDAPSLEARLDEFAKRVDAVRALGEVDEILVVGHSSGAMLAVSTVARAGALAAAARAAQGTDDEVRGRPKLSLLTLGECIPVLSYQPEARAFREELRQVAQSGTWEWVDVTAPPDGCCFALVDPTAACTERDARLPWLPPKRLSPRFAQLFDPSTYRAIRRDKYRCHFQYLMAAELPGAYDYFAITAGTATLADRFSNQSSVMTFRDFQLFGGPP